MEWSGLAKRYAQWCWVGLGCWVSSDRISNIADIVDCSVCVYFPAYTRKFLVLGSPFLDGVNLFVSSGFCRQCGCWVLSIPRFCLFAGNATAFVPFQLGCSLLDCRVRSLATFLITIGYQVGEGVGCHTIETSKQPLTNAGIAVSDKTHYPSTATMRSHPVAVQPVQSVLCDKCLQQFLAQVATGLIVLSILLILTVPSIAMYGWICMGGLAIALFSSRLNPKPNFAMRYTIWFTAYQNSNSFWKTTQWLLAKTSTSQEKII